MVFYEKNTSVGDEMKIRKALPADVEELAHVHIDSWQTTYQGILPDNYLASLNLETRKKNWLRNLDMLHSIHYAAENEEGRIIGFASGGPEQTGNCPIQGEVYAIYLLKDYQRMGIGKKLMKATVMDLIQKQHKNLIIRALKDNPSCAFYESIGGTIKENKITKMAGTELREVGYVWEDIRDIIPHL